VVQVGAKVARVTVQDCVSLAPVAERGGYRRMAFHTRGQQTLFLRCTAEQGGNDFTVGYLAAGPNVFLECALRVKHRVSAGPLGVGRPGFYMMGRRSTEDRCGWIILKHGTKA